MPPEPESFPIAPADFLLPPDSFVDRCVQAFGLADQLGPDEKAHLAAALEGGAMKLALAGMLHDRAYPDAPSLLARRSGAIRRPEDEAILVELLERFAPTNDHAFLTEAYRQVIGAPPSPADEIEGLHALSSQRLTRRALIESLATRNPAITLSAAPHATGLSPAGKPRLLLAQGLPDGSLIVAPDAWKQPPQPNEDGALQLVEGDVLASPKQDLPAGPWLLHAHVVQGPAAELIVEVTANSGLDRLATLHLVGTSALTLRLTIEPHHHFIAIHVRKPPQDAPQNWLRLRDLWLEAQ
jgi:hypothetical protein